MAAIAVPQGAVAPIPRAGFVLLALAVGVLWLVTFEGGPFSGAIGQAGSFLHEMFHDGRHLLGVPCHRRLAAIVATVTVVMLAVS